MSPWRFWNTIHVDAMRTTVRGRRAAMYRDPVPESLFDVNAARFHLGDALETSVDLVEAILRSLNTSWQALHFLDKVVQEAAAAKAEEDAAAAEEQTAPAQQGKKKASGARGAEGG